ncbi:hypothetical protein FISHEDRAFT_75960 [Fistulina hepatica ATCC 64428]|uniref:Uncharacterized protein n=1 Tax=Fistulina hepatica ATCC 64428 TaxID=1128425 RepID=A0A0D7A511_9AGAR|nr:hypothetical protein FISHEDRAFT_75960 [Fistulina hepatica ATCC 64428]
MSNGGHCSSRKLERARRRHRHMFVLPISPSPPLLVDPRRCNELNAWVFNASRHDNTGTSSSSDSVRDEDNIALIDGITYFKIGDAVRVRRYSPNACSWTDWIEGGRVVRPVVSESGRRVYRIAHVDPRTGAVIENDYFPSRKEIEYSKCGSARLPEMNLNVVYAYIHHDAYNVKIWLPAIIVAQEPSGVRPDEMTVYSAHAATLLRRQKQQVEGDGTAIYT